MPESDTAPPVAQPGADGPVPGVDGPGEVPAAHGEAARAAAAAPAAMTAQSRSRAVKGVGNVCSRSVAALHVGLPRMSMPSMGSGFRLPCKRI